MSHTFAPQLFGNDDFTRMENLCRPHSRKQPDFYDAEVMDFDMECHYFNQIEAFSFQEAANIAESLANEQLIQIYNINIYKY